MTEIKEHIHEGRIYLAGGQLVCDTCIPEDKQGGNVCYCACHNKFLARCTKCKIFHRTDDNI